MCQEHVAANIRVHVGKCQGNRAFDHLSDVRELLKEDPMRLLECPEDEDVDTDGPSPKWPGIADLLRAGSAQTLYIIR